MAKPLQTCSLSVERCDDSCIISFHTAKPKEGGPKGSTEPSLFAQCQISLADGKTPMKHWVEAVVDSSRYFAVRISDGKREAHIGMGFRERDDASNFKMSLLEYENSIRRERKAEEMHTAYEEEEDSLNADDGAVANPRAFSLDPGEKIHINLKGTPVKPRKDKKVQEGAGKGSAPLLRKPPPPPKEGEETIAVSMAEMQLVQSQSASKDDSDQDSSECAVVDVDDVDDDEWGDFEGSAS